MTRDISSKVYLVGVAKDKTLNEGRFFVQLESPISSAVFDLVKIKDPWHREAFIGTDAEGYGRMGERKTLWYGEDWCGNLIGEYGDCEIGSIGDELIVKGLDAPVYIIDIKPHFINGPASMWVWEVFFSANPLSSEVVADQVDCQTKLEAINQ